MRLIPILLLAACRTPMSPPGSVPDGQSPDGSGAAGGPIYVPPDPQLTGDPVAGRDALVNNGYVDCGVPFSTYLVSTLVFPPGETIPGRTGDNVDLPYSLTAATTPDGVEVVNNNCLACHASHLLGKVVVGLGAADADFTIDQLARVQPALLVPSLPADYAELVKFVDRMRVLAPYVQEATIGTNPADTLTGVLLAHRDPQTLAWHDQATLPLPPATPLPIHVPPWWRMAKKHAMFYTALGRGDHSRYMMLASTMCTDTVSDATAIASYFDDIEAYITSLRAPAYPFPIDGELAARGKTVFEATCASCHGTYGATGSYPNLVIPTDEIGTDPLLANAQASQFYAPYAAWFASSFYGQTAHADPLDGYYAPPLDGIWATAPYLHNGSVPTIAALLESSKRPQYWTRTFDSTDYDPHDLGWSYTVLGHGQADEPRAAERAKIYDTTLIGGSNVGHLYGDSLTADDRSAVIEYLKTL
jgi:mono/diheme cytochrome c family protein